MRLKIGDKIYCKSKVNDDDDGLTIGKEYIVTNTRKKSKWEGDDICILDDGGYEWWFGQIGETECWTNWFISLREINLKDLGI
jgi:hypothetical protein